MIPIPTVFAIVLVTILVTAFISRLIIQPGNVRRNSAPEDKPNPEGGSVWASDSGNYVAIRKSDEHSVSFTTVDGRGFTRSRRGFMKNYRPTRVVRMDDIVEELRKDRA